MAATQIKRIGYGQVEPNHLSAQKTGQIYAQLPARFVDASDDNAVKPIAQLEQGQFLKYNYAAGRAGVDGDGEWMLVYCEEKLYDERQQHHRDFVLKASDFSDGEIYPRLLKTNVGDIYTTNMINGTTATLTEGKTVAPNATGILDPDAVAAEGMLWEIVKVYDLADGQKAVKLMRIQ